jgi:phosphate transport system protein
MRVSFQEELEALESSLHVEAGLVLRALRGSLNALDRADVELADEVIRFDDEIDQTYFGVQESIQSLLARQTPVAVDLRRVLAMLHMNMHLERMGDYSVTIAKLTKLVDGLDVRDDRIDASLREMGERAEEMIRIALDSFSERDLAKAESLVDLDELIDRANRRAVEDVLSLPSDPASREYGLRMLFVSRCIERIGDHAVDIGEQTAYLITGEFREFTDASHQAAER